MVKIDEYGKLLVDANGKQLWIEMKVLMKGSGESREAPCELLGYEWVTEEHKMEMRMIVAVVERKRPEEYTRKGKFTVTLRKYWSKHQSRQSRRNSSFSDRSTLESDDEDMLDGPPTPNEEELNEELYINV